MRALRGKGIAGAFLMASLAMGSLSAGTVAASGRVRWVDDDGLAGGPRGCDGLQAAQSTVQGGVDASAAGDTVRVCPGTYREVVTVAVAGLTVEGVTGLRARIVPLQNDASTAGTAEPAIHVTANGVTLRNLSVLIPNDCQYLYVGINVELARHVRVLHSQVAEQGPASTTADFCGLQDGIVYNQATGEVANDVVRSSFSEEILVINGSSLSAHDNVVNVPEGPCATAACTAGGGPTPNGIYVSASSATVRHNKIKASLTSGTVTTPTGGVIVDGSLAGAGHVVSVTHNSIRGVSFGVQVRGSSGVVSANNIRGGTGDGISVFFSQQLKIRHNRVTSQGGSGITFSSDSTGNTIRGNNFSGNAGIDCVDASAGPANTWTGNLGDESSPAGLCTP